MTTIKENFSELSITISRQQILDVSKFAINFALRKTHPLTFGGPYLAVDPIVFTQADYETLFDIFGIRKSDVERKIRQTPSINPSFAVTSDPFNLLATWIAHLAPIYIKDKKVCYEFQTNVLKLMTYRIFCSTVNHSWYHGANREVMEATVGSLTLKSDVIRLGSWGAVINAHVEKMLEPKDRFYKTIVDASPDDMFLRVISENQTAIRSKIVTFANAYYEAHKKGESIKSVSAIAENSEGEKIIAQSASVIESATAAMVSEILNPNMFIRDVAVNDVAKSFSTISPRMLKTALLKINETAVLQASSRKFDFVKIDKNKTLYIGVRALIKEIIHSTIRICRTKRVNMGNKAQVFKTMKDTYSNSRLVDENISNIKESIDHLVTPLNITSNAASNSSLRLAVIYYIIYRFQNHMKV